MSITIQTTGEKKCKMKYKISHSMSVLKNLPDECLWEIIDSDEYDNKTRVNAQQVINKRKY